MSQTDNRSRSAREYFWFALIVVWLLIYLAARATPFGSSRGSPQTPAGAPDPIDSHRGSGHLS